MHNHLNQEPLSPAILLGLTDRGTGLRWATKSSSRIHCKTFPCSLLGKGQLLGHWHDGHKCPSVAGKP